MEPAGIEPAAQPDSFCKSVQPRSPLNALGTLRQLLRKGVVFAKFMCATLSTLRTGCMAQSGRATGGIAAAKLALSGANPT